MGDPVTTLGAGALAAYLGKDGLQKLLGPTADYLGQGLRDFTQRRFETIGRIFQNAQSKVGERLEKPGEVPRLLRSSRQCWMTVRIPMMPSPWNTWAGYLHRHERSTDGMTEAPGWRKSWIPALLVPAPHAFSS